jgi:hypothetical protein
VIAMSEEFDVVVIEAGPPGENAIGGDLLAAVGWRRLADGLGLKTGEVQPGRTIEVDDPMRVIGPEYWLG